MKNRSLVILFAALAMSVVACSDGRNDVSVTPPPVSASPEPATSQKVPSMATPTASTPLEPATSQKVPTMARPTASAPPELATLSSSDDRYLEGTVEPCQPVIDDVDPCEPGRPSLAETAEAVQRSLQSRFHKSIHIAGSYVVPETFPTLEELMIKSSENEWGLVYDVPHFVIRGTYTPTTTRCALTDLMFAKSVLIAEPQLVGKQDRDVRPRRASTPIPKSVLTCVTDVSVNEYLVGQGPDTLTVQTYAGPPENAIPEYYEKFNADPSHDFGYDLWRSDIVNAIADQREGREWVLWIGGPTNVTVKAWRVVDSWELELDSGDAIVFHPLRRVFLNNPEILPRVEFTLDDYRNAVRLAHSELRSKHDGRIGSHEDLPAILLDAGAESFEAHLAAEGAYDFPNITPASVPTVDPQVSYPTPTPAPPPPSPTPSPVYLPVVDLVAKVVQTDGGLAVELTWVQPDDDNVITRYQVMREEINDPDGDLIGGNVSSKKEPIAPETSFVDDLLLEPGSTYTYRIRTHGLNFKFVTSELVTITIPSE